MINSAMLLTLIERERERERPLEETLKPAGGENANTCWSASCKLLSRWMVRQLPKAIAV